MFVFGDFNKHHKDWLTYSGGTDRPGELCYNFTQMVNFPTCLTVTLTVLLFWVYLFLLVLVFVLQWLSLHLEILIMLLSQFPLTFQQSQSRMSYFIAKGYFAKGYLKLPNLNTLLPRNWTLGSSGELLIVVSAKVKLLYLLYSTAWRCCFLHLIK